MGHVSSPCCRRQAFRMDRPSDLASVMALGSSSARHEKCPLGKTTLLSCRGPTALGFRYPGEGARHESTCLAVCRRQCFDRAAYQNMQCSEPVRSGMGVLPWAPKSASSGSPVLLRLLEGLSRMRGDSQVRFLGEAGVVTLLLYPTESAYRCRCRVGFGA